MKRRDYKFILLLVSLLSGISLYAEADDNTILWVSVFGEDKHDIKTYFRYDMTVAEWKTYGKDLIDAVVYQKFKTHEFKVQRVSPNECYIFYSERTKKGNMRTYLVSRNSKEKLKSSYQIIERNNYDIIADGCIEGQLQSGPTKDKIEQKPFQGSIMNFVDSAGRASSPRGIYDCPDKDDGQLELVILNDGRYYLKAGNEIKKIDLRSVTKPYGIDEKVILAAQEKLKEGIESSCTFTEEGKRSLLDRAYAAVKEVLLKAIVDCRAAKGEEHKSCQVLEKRQRKMATQASTGIRD